jgi:hypothetical protein
LEKFASLGEEGWWHIRFLLDNLPDSVLIDVDMDQFIFARTELSKERSTGLWISSQVTGGSSRSRSLDDHTVESLIDVRVSDMVDLRNATGRLQLLFAVPGLLGTPETISNMTSILYRITHLDRQANDKQLAFCQSKVVKFIIDYKWRAYAFYTFMFELIVFCIYLSLFTYVSVQFANEKIEEDASMLRGYRPLVVCLCINTFFELKQVWKDGIYYIQGPFMDTFWNVLDWAVMILLALTLWLMHQADEGDKDSRNWALSTCSVTSLLFWMRSIAFGLGFEETGQFVRIVLLIFKDVKYFFGMLAVFLFAFSHGLYLFYHRPNSAKVGDSFDSVSSTLLTTYQMLLGDYPVEELESNGITLIYFLLFSIMVTLTLMNILIAKMTDTYNKVVGMSQQEHAFHQALLIANLEAAYHPYIEFMNNHFFSQDRFKTWIYIESNIEQQSHQEQMAQLVAMSEDIKQVKADQQSFQRNLRKQKRREVGGLLEQFTGGGVTSSMSGMLGSVAGDTDMMGESSFTAAQGMAMMVQHEAAPLNADEIRLAMDPELSRLENGIRHEITKLSDKLARIESLLTQDGGRQPLDASRPRAATGPGVEQDIGQVQADMATMMQLIRSMQQNMQRSGDSGGGVGPVGQPASGTGARTGGIGRVMRSSGQR